MGGRSEIGVEMGDEGNHEVEEEKGFAQWWCDLKKETGSVCFGGLTAGEGLELDKQQPDKFC